MSAAQFPPLVCKLCKGAGTIDVDTEDEQPCIADHCQGGVLVCVTCNDRNGGDEPAVGTVFDWRGDDVVPLCRMHLQQVHAAQAEEGRGDYMRDLQKDGGL